MWKLVSKALTNLMAHFTFLAFNNFDHCGSLMLMLCLQVVSWKLAHPCHHGASFQHCTFFRLVDIVIFCLWILAMWFWSGLVPCHRARGTLLAVFDDTCMLTMTRTCLWPKSSSMRFGYSYFTGHEISSLWFVKHMLHNYTHVNLNHSRWLWWGAMRAQS
jgi:hypothetical protein